MEVEKGYQLSGNKKERTSFEILSFFVRMIGLEPTRLTTLDPKSSAATNYATCAELLLVSECKGRKSFLTSKTFSDFFYFLCRISLAFSIIVSFPC